MRDEKSRVKTSKLDRRCAGVVALAAEVGLECEECGLGRLPIACRHCAPCGFKGVAHHAELLAEASLLHHRVEARLRSGWLHELFEPVEGDWVESRPPCFVGHLGAGGEGIDAGVTGYLYLTREGSRAYPAALEEIRCPDSEEP